MTKDWYHEQLKFVLQEAEAIQQEKIADDAGDVLWYEGRVAGITDCLKYFSRYCAKTGQADLLHSILHPSKESV